MIDAVSALLGAHSERQKLLVSVMIDENVEGGVMSQEGPNLVGLGGDRWGRQVAEPQLLRSENRKDTKEWAEDEVMKDPKDNTLILILGVYYFQKFCNRFIVLYDIPRRWLIR